jgi:hypothetical protein
MQKESFLRSLCERLIQSVLATMPRRPLSSAHQAAANLYDAVDRYTEAVDRNQPQTARAAAERLAVESLRVLMAYELPQTSVTIDNARVENISAAQNRPTSAGK